MARVQLPAAFVESARAFTTGEKQPVEPRNAATVVLLRPGRTGGSEVYLLRRQTSMAFAGGMCVFPGGGVDPRDFDDHDVRWAGPDAATWATGSAPTRRRPGRWCAPRSARPSRSPGCSWPVSPPRPSSPT